MRCSQTINVERLKPFFARAGGPPAPGPGSDAGQEGKHEVELLLVVEYDAAALLRCAPARGARSLPCGGASGCSTHRTCPCPGAPGKGAALARAPLAGGWLGPGHRGSPRSGHWILARYAVRAPARVHARAGGDALPAVCGLAWPCWQVNAPPSRRATRSLDGLPFSGTTVMVRLACQLRRALARSADLRRALSEREGEVLGTAMKN